MYLVDSGVDNVENFNDVGVALDVNLLIKDSYKKTIIYYATYANKELTIYNKGISQNDLEEIVLLLNVRGDEVNAINIANEDLFQNKDESFVKGTLSLDAQKKIKLEKISMKFRNDNIKPVTDVNGILLDSGRIDIQNYESYVELLEAAGETDGTIKTADNNFVTLGVDAIKATILYLKQDALQRFQIKWQKEAAVNNATTIEELDAITV